MRQRRNLALLRAHQLSGHSFSAIEQTEEEVARGVPQGTLSGARASSSSSFEHAGGGEGEAKHEHVKMNSEGLQALLQSEQAKNMQGKVWPLSCVCRVCIVCVCREAGGC